MSGETQVTASPNSLQWFRRASGWIIQGLLGVLFLALVWFLEDRYALISRTAVRIKVTKLAEETNADGKTFLICEFDKYTFKRGVTERLRWNNDANGFCQFGGSLPEWSAQPVTDAFQHALHPFNPKIRSEAPIRGPLASRPMLRPGDVVRLKRGDRVVFAKYKLPPSCDPTDGRDREFEVSYEIE